MKLPILIDDNKSPSELDRCSHSDRLSNKSPLVLYVNASPESSKFEAKDAYKHDVCSRTQQQETCTVSVLIDRVVGKLIVNQKDDSCVNQAPIMGDVMIGKEILYSPSRKMHPFGSLTVPQLSLSLVLISVNLAFERILEDFELLDVSMIQEYSRSRSTVEESRHESVKNDDCNNDPAPSKYYLVLRQSVTKYDMFQRPQKFIAEKKSLDYHNTSTSIQLEGDLEYLTTDIVESISSICDSRSPKNDVNSRLDLDLQNSTRSSEILWRTGNFKLIDDQYFEGIITLQKPLQVEETSSAKNLHNNTHSDYDNDAKTNDENIFKDEVYIEVDLFGPKLKFEKEPERKKKIGSTTKHQSSRDSIPTKANDVTSAHSELFASLSEYDIFYRWQRIQNGDSMTNHNRKSKSVDKKAPTVINNDSDNKTFVRHFIILKPCSRTYKDSQTNIDKMADDNSQPTNKSGGAIKILCFDNSTDFNCWLSGIRLAKFGERLRSMFRHLNGQKHEHDANLIANKCKQMSHQQSSFSPNQGLVGSKSLTVINKNHHYMPNIPSRTTPIQINTHSPTEKGSNIGAARNSSKLHQLKTNLWPSSLPSSAITTSSNIPPDETSLPQSSSNHFLSTLFNNFRTVNTASAHSKLIRKSPTCFDYRDRTDSSSSRAMLISSASTPSHHTLLPKRSAETSIRRASMPVHADENLPHIHGREDLPFTSRSSSTMSNKSSLSSTSTYLKDENVSVHLGLHSTSYSASDYKTKAHATSKKQNAPRFSQENVDEEDIEESTNPDRSYDDVEEAVMVAFDRSGESGELRIVTDPEEIKSIELEEQERKRNTSRLQMVLIQEPWFTLATSFAVNEMIFRAGRIDGCFLIRSSNYRSSLDPNLDSFALTMMHRDNVVCYRIIQKRFFSRNVFTLDSGETNFASIQSLVEFYQLNKGILPCLLTYYPLL